MHDADKSLQDVEAIRDTVRQARRTPKSQRPGSFDGDSTARDSLKQAADELGDLQFDFELFVDPLKPGETRSRGWSRTAGSS